MKPIVFIGQGPNQACWKAGFDSAIKFIAKDPMRTVKYSSAAAGMDAANRFAENYCRRLAITGAIGKKLAALAGCDLKAREELRFYAEHHRRNLNARWNGKDGKGDKFDRPEALVAAAKILAEGFDRHVLLGLEVARAFGCRGELLSERGEYYAPASGGPEKYRRFLVFPHPSGLSTWWNDAFNRHRAEKRLKEFLK